MSQGRKPEDEEGLTSDEIFGDLVDAPAPDKPGRPAGAGGRQRVIKVKVSEPSAAQVRSDPLPEELAALIDAFEEKREEAETLSPPPQPRAPAATPAAGAEPPTPVVLEPLPDLPEIEEPERPATQAEARADFLRLTSRLRHGQPPPAEAAGPDSVELPETALEQATPSDALQPADVVPASAEPDEEGIAYGEYRLLEKIAMGGMAEVFKAKRKGLAGFEKVIAVKRILPHLSHNAEFVEMFVNEAKLVAGLTHPGIVHIHDLGRVGASYYIAMEYVHGRDLRSTLKTLRERGRAMPVGLAVLVTSRVAAALDHAHRYKDADGQPLRIVHRDVSPQNILVSFDGEVKLTDFGIAKAATKASTTERGALRGKLMYMSPEQAWGRPIDHRSDQFSLGVVLYEMLTGERPFPQGGSDMGLIQRVREAQIPSPRSVNASVPPALEAVVLTALAREPEQRYANAGAFHRELEGLLKSEPDASPADLGRFLRELFGIRDDDTQEHRVVAEAPAAASDAEAERPPSLLGPLSAEQLLRRFEGE